MTNVSSGVAGPGGQDIVLSPGGEPWMLFHGWRPGRYRALHAARLAWDGLVPRVIGDS